MLGGLAGQGLAALTGWDIPSGSDVLARLGMDPDSMLTKGLGFGADMLTDPLTWGGGAAVSALSRAGKAASAARQASLVGRLEGMAGSGLRGAEQAASGRLASAVAANGGFAKPLGTPWGADVLGKARIADPSRVPIAIAKPRGLAALPETVPGGGTTPTPPSPLTRTIRAATPAGTPGSVQGFAHDADALRSLQLNSPHFNPAEPVFGLGTGQFVQDAGTASRYGLGEYNPLTTTSLVDRLRSMQSAGPVY